MMPDCILMPFLFAVRTAPRINLLIRRVLPKTGTDDEIVLFEADM